MSKPIEDVLIAFVIARDHYNEDRQLVLLQNPN
jgi:hypothetical protein